MAITMMWGGAAGAQAQGNARSIPAGGDQTLELPSAASPAPAAPPAAAPAEGRAEKAAPAPDASQTDIGSDNAPLPADLPEAESGGPLPYLGVSVVYTVASRDGQRVSGLQVVDVDADSPAARAGLKARTPASTLGASGATAGELLGPLDAALKPLLAKSGQLGKDGDLIVAIDDHRVTGDSDLPDHLARLHPGDIIYLTVLRQQRGGTYKAVKLPVTLGISRNASARR
ncbi:MAG TPA: PDZ domain-containing protein [Candidatus Binataceae bacterium]|nr:PDZ domain-containing protein [Candidatus Binataceae bacterium]